MGIPKKIQQEVNILQEEILQYQNSINNFDINFEHQRDEEDFDTNEKYEEAIKEDYNREYEYFEKELENLEQEYNSLIAPYTLCGILNKFLDDFQLAGIGNSTDCYPTKDIRKAMKKVYAKLEEVDIDYYFEQEILETFIANYNLVCENTNFLKQKGDNDFMDNYNSPWQHNFIEQYNKKGLEIRRH